MIVLDTHALIWWISDPDRLSAKAGSAISKAKMQKSVYVSSISVWEIAMLVKKGRLKLKYEVNEWLRKIESLPFIKFWPVTNKISFDSVFLSGNPPADPADRIIISTAINLGYPLISADQKIRRYPKVKTIW